MATPKAEYESCSDDAPLPQRRREATDSDISDDGLPARKNPRGRTWYDDEFEGQGRAPESEDEFEVQGRALESHDDDVVKAVNQKDNERVEKQHMSSHGSLKGQSFRGESRGFISTNPTGERYGIRTGSPYTGDAQSKGNKRRVRLSSRFEKMKLKDERGLVSQVRLHGHRSGYGRGNGSEELYNQNNYDRSDNGPNNDRRNYDQNNDLTYYNRSNYGSSNGPNYNLKNDQSYYKDQRNYGKSSDPNYALNNDQSYYNHRRNYGKSSDPNYALNNDQSYNNDQKNYDKSNGPNRYDRSNGPRNYDRVDYDSSNYERNNFYNRNNARSSARGKGQKRYIPARNKSNELPVNQYNQSVVPDSISMREPYVSNVQPDPVHPQKNAVTSNLNPAEPPYYTGVSSLIGPNIPETQCGTFMDGITNSDIVVGNSNANPQVQFLGPNMKTNDTVVVGNSDINPQAQQLGCWLDMNTTASLGLDMNTTTPLGRWENMNTNDTVVVGNSDINSQVQQLGCWVVMNTNDTVVVGNSDINSQVQQLGCWVDMNTTESIGQPALQASSLHQDPTLDSFEHEELNKFRTLRTENEKTDILEPEMGTIMPKSQIECPLCSNKSKTPFVEKKNAGIPEWQRDTYVYNGALLGTVGALDLPQRDQGGLGVPAVGRVLSDKVDHSQHGFGNSWQPMLAGSAGALGTSNCSPDAVLGSSVQTSSVSIIDGSSASLVTTGNPPQSSETVNDEIPQLRRRLRYSEMNFGKL